MSHLPPEVRDFIASNFPDLMETIEKGQGRGEINILGHVHRGPIITHPDILRKLSGDQIFEVAMAGDRQSTRDLDINRDRLRTTRHRTGYETARITAAMLAFLALAGMAVWAGKPDLLAQIINYLLGIVGGAGAFSYYIWRRGQRRPS
ncbi:MAG: hypothetical protein HYT99_03515 [Candidatus Tectomicrobia bacterium]|nr:hypothetical protein [Candidatus Tectomicrobia bacterium]MBI2131879.1 hypothetical protein [Candidatus Tectomicrobia bacterium]MBI2177590.1 hypothetical protein [Candidatus Tectomicrobia bacterium]